MSNLSSINSEKNPDSPEIRSYKSLRYLLGILGITLSAILYFGNAIFYEDSRLRDSMSQYYHTGMRDIFVGYLFGIGLFLYSYNGYKKRDDDKHLTSYIGDNEAGKIAGMSAIVVAVFPTVAEGVGQSSWINDVHLIGAALLYAILAYFCYFLFTKEKPSQKNPAKLKRNTIYRYCGSIIAISLGLLIIVKIFDPSLGPLDNLTFWFETIMNVTFGIAWFVKGDGLKYLLDEDDPKKVPNIRESINDMVVIGAIIIGYGGMLIYTILF